MPELVVTPIVVKEANLRISRPLAQHMLAFLYNPIVIARAQEIKRDKDDFDSITKKLEYIINNKCFNIDISDSEATYLMHAMHNPISDEEEDAIRKCRELVFKSLEGAGFRLMDRFVVRCPVQYHPAFDNG